MEQNIGQFISQLRKQKGMTQKELADIVGVSDKTISKWEHVKSLPDTALLLTLCKALDISVNELVTCKKLLKEEYSENAEVNMMNLLREKEESRRISKITLSMGIGLGILVLVFWYMVNFGLDLGMLVYFVDIPSLIYIVLACFTTVLLSGACKIIDIIRVIQKTLIPAGGLAFIVSIVVIMIKIVSIDQLGPNLVIALIAPAYSILGYIILIPFVSSKEK